MDNYQFNKEIKLAILLLLYISVDCQMVHSHSLPDCSSNQIHFSSSLFWTDLEKYPEVKAAKKFIVEESKVLYRSSSNHLEASQSFSDEFVMEMAEHILAR